jgi:hypothetical protein
MSRHEVRQLAMALMSDAKLNTGWLDACAPTRIINKYGHGSTDGAAVRFKSMQLRFSEKTAAIGRLDAEPDAALIAHDLDRDLDACWTATP